MTFKEIIKIALKYIKRRDFLGKRQKRCPSCGTEHCQLINKFDNSSEWKCGFCKIEFIIEPVFDDYLSR